MTSRAVVLSFAFMMLVLVVVAEQLILQNGQGDYGSVIKVCEGQRIPMEVHFKKHTAKGCSVVKHNIEYGLSEYPCQIKNNPGVKNRGIASYIINDATTEDTGRYEMIVFFTDVTNEWMVFHVHVHNGCPDRTEFFDPAISYKLDAGPLRSLPYKSVIAVRHDTNVTINVSIPVATPPVHCNIKGQGQHTTMRGSSSHITYCLATYPVIIKPGGTPFHLVEVRLMQPQMIEDFARSINIHITDGRDDGKSTDSLRTVATSQRTLTSQSDYSRLDVFILVVVSAIYRLIV